MLKIYRRKPIWKKTYHYAVLEIKTLQEKLANHHIENENGQILQEDVKKQKKLEVKDWEEYDKSNYSFKGVRYPKPIPK